MKISHRTGAKLLVLGGLLGIGSASFVQDAKAQNLHACRTGGTGETGCITNTAAGQEGQCVFYAPNYGITYRATWTCYYDSEEQLAGSGNYSCVWALNGGCCNNLDSGSQKCPSLTCESHVDACEEVS